MPQIHQAVVPTSAPNAVPQHDVVAQVAQPLCQEVEVAGAVPLDASLALRHCVLEQLADEGILRDRKSGELANCQVKHVVGTTRLRKLGLAIIRRRSDRIILLERKQQMTRVQAQALHVRFRAWRHLCRICGGRASFAELLFPPCFSPEGRVCQWNRYPKCTHGGGRRRQLRTESATSVAIRFFDHSDNSGYVAAFGLFGLGRAAKVDRCHQWRH
mmetsp:Transcript_10561/g.30078  ORF Transcript_10561/g.30078 Transcript_10561/m.30078 type:complete len:215 (+) Transcript_10561:462-1106(+)